VSVEMKKSAPAAVAAEKGKNAPADRNAIAVAINRKRKDLR